MEHYQLITDGKYIYYYNCRTGDKGIKSTLDSAPTECMLLTATSNLKQFKFFKGTKIIDPLSEKLYVKLIGPNIYLSNYYRSMKYLYTMLSNGWQIVGKYSNCDEIKCILINKGNFCEVVIMNDKLEIFQNLKENFIDPWTYINES
jgi:hypothetical protein